MGGPEPLCPLCAKELSATTFAGVDLRFCAPPCKAVLLAQRDMIRMLEGMSGPLLEDFDPDTKLEPVVTQGGPTACPVCARAMAREDYCAAGLARFDRCTPCGLLWIGADQLRTMTMMWARMERRSERTQKIIGEALAETNTFVDTVLLGRWYF